MAEDIVYALYTFLAFSEVLVLLASAIAVLTFGVWQVVKKFRSLMDVVADSGSGSTEPSVQTLNPVGAGSGRRAPVIPGGHNERF